MKTLLLTVGLPRSGKSTWARKQLVPVVNPDSIRLAIHGQPYISETEVLVWPIATLMVRSLFLAGHDYVIVDATNITQKRRKYWHDNFEDENCMVEHKYFEASKQICILRAKEDGREDLIPIIERMYKERADELEALNEKIAE